MNADQILDDARDHTGPGSDLYFGRYTIGGVYVRIDVVYRRSTDIYTVGPRMASVRSVTGLRDEVLPRLEALVRGER